MSEPLVRPAATLPFRRIAIPVAVGAAALTLLFTAQDALRGAGGPARGVWRSFATSAIDWGAWALLVPVIVAVGARIRLDERRARARNVLAWVVLGLGCHLVQATVTGAVLASVHLLPLPPALESAPLGRLLPLWVANTTGYNLIIFALIAAAFHVALYAEDARARRIREAELAARLAHAELTVLRMQLQPHFFFNALHTVSSLMVTDVPTAQRVISALGDLVRASIDHTLAQEIALRDELAFVRRYVDIQTARFRRRLTVTEEIAPDALDALVPSLVLQPLVENAIRHGVEPFATGGRVWIRAARRGDELTLSVVNDASQPVAVGGSRRGIGLANLEARLAQLYGTAHRFRAGHAPDGSFEVVLAMPFRSAGGVVPAEMVS